MGGFVTTSTSYDSMWNWDPPGGSVYQPSCLVHVETHDVATSRWSKGVPRGKVRQAVPPGESNTGRARRMTERVRLQGVWRGIWLSFLPT